jgi:hypothetical protein
LNKSFFVYLTVAGLILSACNFPEDSAASQELMMTAAALTVESALKTPLATPTLASTPSVVTGETQSASSFTSTPSSGQAMASVGDVTNCRSGPGTNYERITQILPAEQLPIVGFFPPNYWIVNSKLGQCWLSGEFATPSGNFAAVPTVTAPPTPQGNKPEAPTFPNNGWTYLCYGPGQADIVLNWNDKANNETGYRVLRNGEIAAELPANSTNFSETIALNSGQSVSYQIQAYNLIGESISSTAKITCP